ncbi:MAG: PDZ domain-containing protein [Candidatus Omnitrophota bacterium]|nr:PDZ domain-containing protein [Candidatus Omnitrophota bacterium]
MKRIFLTAIFFSLIILMPGQAIAQEYPPNYRDIPCPDTGLTLYQTAPEYFAQSWLISRGPRHYAARCHYGDASIVGTWSDDFASKDIICNWEPFKKNLLGDRYGEEERTRPAGKAFWFSYQLDEVAKDIVVVTVLRDGPMDRAGVKVNDRILTIDGLNVSKFTLDELMKLLQSREEVTFKIYDAQKMIYRDLKVKKEFRESDEKAYDLFSPVHFAVVGYSYPIRKGREKEDYEFWHSKALEFLKKFEDQGVVCKDLDVSEKGPVAE